MLRGLFFGLFFPAGLGLAWRWATTPGLAAQVLVFATLLLSIEQARAAVVDLQNIRQVATATDDARLPAFRRLVWAVITLELLGFYGASLEIGWGVVVVLCSQVLFNGFARIALFPHSADPIRPWRLWDRLPVLGADGVGLVLAGCWIAGIAPLVCAIALLMIVLVYLLLKYAATRAQIEPVEATPSPR